MNRKQQQAIWVKIKNTKRVKEGESLRITGKHNGKKWYAKAGSDNEKGFVEVIRPNQFGRSYFPVNQVEIKHNYCAKCGNSHHKGKCYSHD